MSATHFTIPDFLRNWPWPRKINPHYEQCKVESTAWLESFHAFSPRAQEAFNKCDFNLLAALVFKQLNKDGCRIACDMMNLFWVFDEHSDVVTADVARQQADIMMDALRYPSKARASGEWVGGEVARQFWVNALRTATPTSQHRFIIEFKLYSDAVVEQAEDREHGRIRDIKSYFDLRRDNVAIRVTFAILEVHLNLPDRVFSDPIIDRLIKGCVDMVFIGNDVLSYNIEQACGVDGHNLVAVVMQEKEINLDNALKWIGDTHDQIASKFLADYKQVPSFGDPNLDAEVAIYVDGLGNWVRANNKWSFETPRYFGLNRREVEAKRIVALLPKKILLETEAGDLAEQVPGEPSRTSQSCIVGGEHNEVSSYRRGLHAVCYIEDGPQSATAEPIDATQPVLTATPAV